ncbi:MAG: pirin family protein, partial [Alphaproteobacteria bacterium]
MSWQDCPEAHCHAAKAAVDPVEMTIMPRRRDLGGFTVGRVLPSAKRRMVGPFIFFDQVGPSVLRPGEGIDVRPHPHIGLATVTYLFEGELLHRDSLGSVQPIRPGDVNWMTAGRGIVHSERTPPAERARQARLFGIQAWVALPEGAEETAPAFVHHAKAALPAIAEKGLRVRVIAGRCLGKTSPVQTLSETVYADAEMAAGATLPFDAGCAARAFYVVAGEVTVGGHAHGAGTLLVLRPGETVAAKAHVPSRVMLLGGEPMEGPRYIW